MSDKVLQVIEPFFVLEIGDTLELSEDGKTYVSEYNEEYHENGDSGSAINSTYTSKYTISKEYAETLIKEGYLERLFAEDKPKTPFVNVFDEIDILKEKYSEELDNIAEDMADLPECVKVEKTTVLTNMIKVLDHLKSLKK